MTNELTKRDDERNRKIVWRSVGHKSVREIAEATGLTTQEVVALRNELFDEVDVLSTDQRRMKIILDLDEIASRARELVESVGDERAKAPLLTAATGALKTVLQALERLEKQDTSKVDSLNTLRRTEVRRVYEDAATPFLDWLESEGYVDRETSEPVFQQYMLEAARLMDERNES